MDADPKRKPLVDLAGESQMSANPKRKSRQDEYDRSKRARARQEEALDDALKNTFPASDPISIEQPAPPDAYRAKT
jgi:hypothetical protein